MASDQLTTEDALSTYEGPESPCSHCGFPVEANIGQAEGPFAYVHSMTGMVYCQDEQEALKNASPVKDEGRPHGMSAGELRKAHAADRRQLRKM
jgi:hypothetical protein